ncbi:ribosomal-processing cysteine protease Prp [Candidatus Stoquefichus massiliensis]|uniref:ribosomal-processing cysteine protease Prp n=1 Tax=Candidatus Stoquefichus massiliensis TaxID=1470350 RepID=UPI000483BBEC|nr:ribosomal-processing cysteine protease Prp [Candidatus Stoquefichus massiliensis]
MIEVIVKEKEQEIVEIGVSGHADSAEHGKDLVCAGVSTACVGIANALVKNHFLDEHKGILEVREGFVYIKVNHSDCVIQVVLETFVTILETIEESYAKYMKIKKMEVGNHDV